MKSWKEELTPITPMGSLFTKQKGDNMKTQKVGHTPGQWKVVNNGLGHAVIVVGPTGKQHTACIESLKSNIQEYEIEELEANARLIAAAPELLKALNACLVCLTLDSDMEEDFSKEIKLAKNAIAKAEGRK